VECEPGTLGLFFGGIGAIIAARPAHSLNDDLLASSRGWRNGQGQGQKAIPGLFSFGRE
jgi:hypothetical protein